MGVPRTAFDVRHETSTSLTERLLGYRQSQVLAYIEAEKEETGLEPSYSMIREALGFTQDCDVRAVVVGLERRGLLKRAGSGRERRIRLVVNNAQ